MNDDVDVSVGAEEDGSTPSAEDSEQLEQESAASALEAEAAEPESNEEKPAVADSAKGRAGKLQKLIDSKGGDEDRFADSLYEMMNSNKKLFQEIQDLKQSLAERHTTPDPEPPLEDDEDYQWLKEQITVLESANTGISTARQGLVQKFNQTEAKIARLQGQADIAPDSEKSRIHDLIYREEAVKERLQDKWDQLQEKESDLAIQKKRYERDLKQHETRIKQSRTQQVHRQREDVAEQAELRGSFDSTVYGLLDEAGLEDDDRSELYEVVKLQAAVYIQKNGEVPDLAKLGADIAMRHINRIKRSEFQKVSQAKKAIAPSAPAPSTAPKAPTTPPTAIRQSLAQPKNGKLTAEQAKANIAKWARG